MFHAIGHRLTVVAMKHCLIRKVDQELYDYAYTLLISYLFTWGSFLAASIFFNLFFPSLLYMAYFSALRIYAGGTHATSYERCYFISLVIFVGTIIMAKWVVNHVSINWVIFCFLFSALFVFFLSPMEDPNKPLDEQELKRYKKITRIVILCEGLAVGIMALLSVSSLYYVMLTMGPITVSGMLVAQRVNAVIHTRN